MTGQDWWTKFELDMADIDRADANYRAFMDAEMFLMELVAGLERIPYGREALADLILKGKARELIAGTNPRWVNLDA